jgi:hypothetical protein
MNLQETAKFCPITSITFHLGDETEADLYEWRGVESNEDTRGVFISKKVMSHGIQNVAAYPDEC